MKQRTACWAALALLTMSPAGAQTPVPRPDEYGRITRVPRQEVNTWLLDELRRSHGDPDRQRYRFILGFSTGHFGSDPVQAIAMRRTVFSLLNNTLAAGDRVVPVAWEMEVWNTGQPVTLSSDPQTRAEFVNGVPYAPAAKSEGGHDVERALHDCMTRLVPPADAANTVVLLFTNSNQSQGPTGRARSGLFGANNPQLLGELRERKYREPVRKSFESDSRDGKRLIEVTALFPEQAAGLAGAPNTPRFPTFSRKSWQPPADAPPGSEKLPNGTMEEAATSHVQVGSGNERPSPDRSGLLYLIIGLGIVAGGVVIWLLRRQPKKAVVPAQPAPRGRPLPGQLNLVLGLAPRSVTVSLQPLTSTSEWALVRDGAMPAVVPAAGERPAIAMLRLDSKGSLHLESGGQYAFRNPTGSRANLDNPRHLVLQPGGRLLCEAFATTTGDAVRVEVNYLERAAR